MEGAAGGVVLSGFFQLNTRTHHFDNVGAVEQVINEGLRDQAGHKDLDYARGKLRGNEKTPPIRQLAKRSLSSAQMQSPVLTGLYAASSYVDQYRRTLRRCSRCTFLAWRFTAAAALRLRSAVGFS